MNFFFSSIAWSQAFHTSMYSNSAFPNTFFYLQNLFGTSFFKVSLSDFSSLLTCFFSLFFLFLWFLSHKGRHLVIFIFSFSQSILRLCTANHGIPKITSILPKLYISIFTHSICPLQYKLHSISCITISLLFFVLLDF